MGNHFRVKRELQKNLMIFPFRCQPFDARTRFSEFRKSLFLMFFLTVHPICMYEFSRATLAINPFYALIDLKLSFLGGELVSPPHVMATDATNVSSTS